MHLWEQLTRRGVKDLGGGEADDEDKGGEATDDDGDQELNPYEKRQQQDSLKRHQNEGVGEGAFGSWRHRDDEEAATVVGEGNVSAYSSHGGSDMDSRMWRARRCGSLAARLLKDIVIPCPRDPPL